MTVPIPEQVECVERELRYRERVYARRVADGRMTEAQSARELARMRAVLDTLHRVQARDFDALYAGTTAPLL